MNRQNRTFWRPSRAVSQRFALPLLAALLLPAAAHAQQRSFVALGAASVPEFEGSADTAVAPFLAGRVDFGSAGSLRLAGLGASYNLLGDDSPWAFGPVLSLRPKRDSGVNDEVVQRLREIDATAEIGAFVEYGWRDALGPGDRLGLGLEAKGGKGGQVALTLGYLAPRSGAFQFGADARLVFANGNYMETYFSVDADNSARSGLPEYTAASGLKNASFGLTATYDLDRDWLLLARVGVSRLLGDAKDSPIVQLRGDANATTVGLAVGYRF